MRNKPPDGTYPGQVSRIMNGSSRPLLKLGINASPVNLVHRATSKGYLWTWAPWLTACGCDNIYVTVHRVCDFFCSIENEAGQYDHSFLVIFLMLLIANMRTISRN